MKKSKKFKKEQFYLSCIIIGPCLAYASVFYPALSVLAIVFIIIGIKGILAHVM